MISFKITSLLGFVFSSLGLGLAIWSPAPLANIMIYTSSFLAILGLGLFLGSNLGGIKIVESLEPRLLPLLTRLRQLCPDSKKTKKQVFEKQLIKLNTTLILWLGQCVLMVISVLFFNMLEVETRINPRLQALPDGYFLQLLKSNILMLGFWPWVIYAILGVGLAYFSVIERRIPYLPKIIIPNPRRQPRLFIHNFLSIITEVNFSFSALFITSLVIFYLSDAGSVLLGNVPLHQTPILTTMVLAMLMLAFRLINIQSIHWMIEARLSLGNMLIIILLAFSFSIVWLYHMGNQYLMQAGPQILNMMSAAKSLLVNSMQGSILQTRFDLLIWAWWMVWIPWMITFTARWSIGFTVRVAIFRAIICPMFMFSWIYKTIDTSHWQVFSAFVTIPKVQLAIAVALIGFIWKMYGKMQTTWDISLGCMLPLRRWRYRNLREWMKIFLPLLMIYLIGSYTSGWMPTQVMATYGAVFLTLLTTFFLGVLVLHILDPESSKQTEAQSITLDPTATKTCTVL